MSALFLGPLGVVPVLVGPLLALLALLPAIMVGLGGLVIALFRPAALKKGAKVLWRQKVAVLGLAAVVAGIVFLVRSVRAGPGSGDVATQEAGAANWVMYRGDAGRRGWVPSQGGSDSAPARPKGGTGDDGTADPLAGGVLWRFAEEARTFYSSPAVVGNRVYVASAKKNPFSDRGAIYCLDADSGAWVWKSAPDGFRATFSSPSVTGKYLVCGEGLHDTRDARVVCLDVTRQGALVWQYRTSSHVESSPCIWNGRVYVGAGDDGFYCFELEPDATGGPRLVWHAEGKVYPDAESSPLVHEGRMYAGLGMAGNAVICLDAATGAEVWRVPTPYPVCAPPTLAQGRLFVGMGNGDFVYSGEEVRARELKKLRREGRSEAELAEAARRLAPGGEVWCMNPADGTLLWRFRTGEVVLNAITAGRDRIFFGARDGLFYALTGEGREVARWNVYASVLASPALAGEHAYVVTGAGRLYAFAEDRRDPVWTLSLGSRGLFLSSPAVGRGHVYVGTGEDGFLCVGTPAARQQPLWPGALGGPGMGGTVDGSAPPPSGQFLWRHPREEGAEPVVITAAAACVGSRLYVPLAGGPRRGLAALRRSPAVGKEPAEEWFFPTPHGVAVSPVATEQRVFVVDGRRGEKDRSLCCLDAASGASRWHTPVAADASCECLLTRERLVIEAEPGVLVCFDHEGQEQWRRAVGPLVGAPAARDAILVVATTAPPALTALDLPTGATLWVRPLDAPPLTGPVVREQVLYVGTAPGIAAHSLVDGRRLWETASGAPDGAFAASRGRIAYVTTGGELVLLDAGPQGAANPPAATVSWRRSGAARGAVPMLLSDAVLCPGAEAIQRFDLASGEPRAWMDTSWLGALMSPPVLADGMVYFGVEGIGLVCAGPEAGGR